MTQEQKQEKPTGTSILSWLLRVGVGGAIVGTLIASYFQYKASQQEYTLAQHKEDFEIATKTFAEAADALESATQLQIALYYTYSEAYDAKKKNDPSEYDFLKRSAMKLYNDYAT